MINQSSLEPHIQGPIPCSAAPQPHKPLRNNALLYVIQISLFTGSAELSIAWPQWRPNLDTKRQLYLNSFSACRVF